MIDTRLKKSTAFHPEIDGQTEVVNKTVIQLLKGYYSKHPKLWDEHLCYVQHAYNRAKHFSTQRSPFETRFGFTPMSPLDFVFGKDIAVDGHNDVDKATKFIEHIKKFTRQCRNSWKRAEPSTRQGMIRIELSITSKLVIKSGYISARTKCKLKERS